MNIYEKLIEVRKSVPYLQKEAKGYQYMYNPSSQVLAAVRDKMDELKLLLIPEILSHAVTTSATAKGNTNYFTELDMKMTWVNADEPEERIPVLWYAQGMDTEGEKGCGKAETYAEKYFLLKFFNIATDKDDPDSFESKPAKRSKTTEQPVATPKVPAKNEPLSTSQSSLIWDLVAKTTSGEAITIADTLNKRFPGRLQVIKEKGIWEIKCTRAEASKIIGELQGRSA